MSNQLHDIPGLHQLQVAVPAAGAADATAYLAFVRMPFKCKVKSAFYAGATAITGDATNTANLNVDKVIAGTATEIANKDYGAGVNYAVRTVETLGSDLDVELAEGDLVALEREKVGTGAALGAGVFVVTIVGN